MFSFEKDLADFGDGSNNDGDDFDKLSSSKSSSSTKSRLANLFTDDVIVDEKPKTVTAIQSESSSKNAKAAPITVFSAVVHLYSANESGSYLPVGKVGLAIVRRPNISSLLIYSGSKQAITQVVLSRALPLSIVAPYLYITDERARRWSLHFDVSDQLQTALTWIVLISSLHECVFDISPGLPSGEPISDGDSVLLDVIYSVEEEEGILKATEESDVKLRISSRKNKDILAKTVIGMKKGGVRLTSFSDGRVAVLIVKKVKGDRHGKETPAVVKEADVDPEDEPLCEDVAPATADVTIAKEEEDLEAEHSDEVNEDTKGPDAVLARIARVGRPLFGAPIDLPALQSIDDRTEVDQEKNQAPVPRRTVGATVPVVAAPQHQSTVTYEDVHRAVGVEMDRLQNRLELSFVRILEQAIAPIREEQNHLREQQATILRELQTLRVSNTQSTTVHDTIPAVLDNSAAE